MPCEVKEGRIGWPTLNVSAIGTVLKVRFAPQAAVSRFQLDRQGSTKTTSPRDSAAAIHHHSRTCRERGGCQVQYRVRNIGRFSDAPDRQSLRYAGKHCLAFGFCHAGPQWSRDQSGRDCVHSDRSEFKSQAARQRLECGVDGALQNGIRRRANAAEAGVRKSWAELLGLRRPVTARRQRALCRSQLEDRRLCRRPP